MGGFTLITLNKETETKNWRFGSEDLHIFHAEMEKYLIKMYPQTKRFLWSSNVVRGDTKFLDQPPAINPHLDYYQGDEERKKFHQVYPPPNYDPQNKTEAHILLGEWDTENEKLGVILGVWKPLYPNPGKWWSNPHSSFQNKNCPVGTETRISAELRVALF